MPEAETNADQTALMLDLTREHLYALARGGTIPKPIDGRWNVLRCNVLYIRFLRDGKSASAKEDKARKARAEADMAEMACGKMAGTMCLRSDYLNNYADAIAIAVTRISRLHSLTTKQMEDVIAILRSVKLPDLEKEKPEGESEDGPDEKL